MVSSILLLPCTLRHFCCKNAGYIHMSVSNCLRTDCVSVAQRVAPMAFRLGAIAALSVLNVWRLTAVELPALLPVLLPASWRGAAAVHWTPGEGGQPTEQWLTRLWAKLQV